MGKNPNRAQEILTGLQKESVQSEEDWLPALSINPFCLLMNFRPNPHHTI